MYIGQAVFLGPPIVDFVWNAVSTTLPEVEGRSRRPDHGARSRYVEDLKANGNQSFKEGAYQQAVEFYTQALDAAAENAVLYSNRCAALLKLGRVGEARADAEKCIHLRPEWEKAHFRLGSVCVEEGNWEEALAAYSKCAELAPADTSGEVARKIKWLERQCTRGKPPSRGAAFAGFSEGRGGGGSGGPAPAAMPGADLLRELGVEGPVRVPENVDAGLEPAAWARAFSGAKRYEWLVDCYRMRVDDEHVWGGGKMRGLYAARGNSR